MWQRLTQLLTLLGLNSVPAIGWFVGGWSAGTTLGLYWIESVLSGLLFGAKVLLHSRVNPRRGHFDYRVREGTNRSNGGTYLSAFFPILLIFTAAHGFFLAMLVFLLTHNGKGAEIELNWEELWKGSLIMAGLLVFNFLLDLPGLKKRSFLWAESQGDRLLSRVFVVHITLIFGMAAVAFTGVTRSFFAVFVVLKTMADLAGILPQWNPKEPPKWLCTLMDKVPNANKSHANETFAEFWKKDNVKENNRKVFNEEPWELKPGKKS